MLNADATAAAAAAAAAVVVDDDVDDDDADVDDDDDDDNGDDDDDDQSANLCCRSPNCVNTETTKWDIYNVSFDYVYLILIKLSLSN